MTRRDATLVHLELLWGTDPDTIAFLVRSTRSRIYWHLQSWGATETAKLWRDVAWQEEPA